MTEKEREQEKMSLLQVRDSFKKIIVVKDIVNVTRDENGITTMSVYDFLLKDNSLELQYVFAYTGGNFYE